MAIASLTRSMTGSLIRALWNRDRSAIRRRGSRARFIPSLDCLESRRALAITGPLSIGGTTVGFFTDTSGDTVTVNISGTAGSVVFNGGSGVADGGDILSIDIVDASPDFELTVGATVGDGSDGVVQLGTITVSDVILGINTIRGSLAQPSFELTTLVGVNFSRDGGLFVDNVVGADTVVAGQEYQNLGILLSGGLTAGATVNVREELGAGIVLGTNGKARVDGLVFVETATEAEDEDDGSYLVIGPQSKKGSKSTFELHSGYGYFGADVTFTSVFNGVMNVDSARGSVTFARGVGRHAVLQADRWMNLLVEGDFAGHLGEDSSGTNIEIRGNVAKTARIQTEGNSTVAVSGSIAKGASLVCDGDLTLLVGKDLRGTVIGGYASDGFVGGSVIGGTLGFEGSMDLTVAKDFVSSSLLMNQYEALTLSVGGSVRRSTVQGGVRQTILDVAGTIERSRFIGGIDGSVGGSVIRSKFFSDGITDGTERDISLSVAGSVTSTAFLAAGDLNVAADQVAKSQFSSARRDVTVAVSRSIRNSTLVATVNGVALSVGQDAVNTKLFTDDDDLRLNVGRNFSGLAQSGSGDLLIDIAGSVLKGSSLITGEHANIRIGGDLDGFVVSSRLQFLTEGNVSKRSRIVAERVFEFQPRETDTQAFRIGGRLDGVVSVEAGFEPMIGDSTSATILGNGAGRSARFTVNQFTPADEPYTLTFDGNFLGEMRIAQDLTSDLVFSGDVNSLSVGGMVASSIAVAGNLRFLNTNSYFEPIVLGRSGRFWSDASSVDPSASTGTLDTGSYETVVPVRVEPLQ